MNQQAVLNTMSAISLALFVLWGVNEGCARDPGAERERSKRERACAEGVRLGEAIRAKAADPSEIPEIADRICENMIEALETPETCAKALVDTWRGIPIDQRSAIVGYRAIALDQCIEEGHAPRSESLRDCVPERSESLMRSDSIAMDRITSLCEGGSAVPR